MTSSDRKARRAWEAEVREQGHFGFHSNLEPQHNPYPASENLEARNLWRAGWEQAKREQHERIEQELEDLQTQRLFDAALIRALEGERKVEIVRLISALIKGGA